jgi:putative phage-type endonuclease
MPELIPAEPGTPGWLAARKAGVTATDIVTILGLSHYDSVYSLFWRKMQQAPEVEDNDRFALGRALEPYVVERWRLEHGYGLSNIIDGKLYRSSGRPWQMATLDRWLVGDLEGWPLEVKTWADADKSSWQDAPPAQVRAQVLWQMDVMGVAVGHVGVVFLPSGEFRSYTIEHQNGAQCWGNMECSACVDLMLMREAGYKFMQQLRLELPPPDPDSSAATLAAVRARFTRQPAKEAEVEHDLWQSWIDARNDAAIYETQARGFEIKLREQMGEATLATVDGQPVARCVVSDQNVKAHARHMDYLTRIKTKGDDDA